MKTLSIYQQFFVKLSWQVQGDVPGGCILGRMFEFREGDGDPHWFHFQPHYLQEFGGLRLAEDGRATRDQLFDFIKNEARKLVAWDIIPDIATLYFGIVPIQEVF